MAISVLCSLSRAPISSCVRSRCTSCASCSSFVSSATCNHVAIKGVKQGELLWFDQNVGFGGSLACKHSCTAVEKKEEEKKRKRKQETKKQTNKKKDTTTALRRGKLHEWVQLKPIGGGYVHVHLKSHTCFSASTRRAHMVLWTSLLAAWPARSRRCCVVAASDRAVASRSCCRSTRSSSCDAWYRDSTTSSARSLPRARLCSVLTHPRRPWFSPRH